MRTILTASGVYPQSARRGGRPLNRPQNYYAAAGAGAWHRSTSALGEIQNEIYRTYKSEDDNTTPELLLTGTASPPSIRIAIAVGKKPIKGGSKNK